MGFENTIKFILLMFACFSDLERSRKSFILNPAANLRLKAVKTEAIYKLFMHQELQQILAWSKIQQQTQTPKKWTSQNYPSYTIF